MQQKPMKPHPKNTRKSEDQRSDLLVQQFAHSLIPTAIDTLCIRCGAIGNWGQPFRKDSHLGLRFSATILHLLGLDHERLSFYRNGYDVLA